MSLENRLLRLEKQTEAIQEHKWIIVIHRGGREITEAEKEAAIEDYKARVVDWEKRDVNIVYIRNYWS